MPRLSINLEPEIQFRSNEALSQDIENWLKDRGLTFKERPARDVTYYDTPKFRLLREGLECRSKNRKGPPRHDMKVPRDLENTHAMKPDENGILWRLEIEASDVGPVPVLSDFRDATVLAPVAGRVPDFFKKNLEPKIIACFASRMALEERDGEEVEYKLDRGYIRSARNPDVRTNEIFIVEIELKSGGKTEDADPAPLLAAITEMESVFQPQGLVRLDRRKLIIGLDLIENVMPSDVLEKYHEGRANMVDLIPS